jgi:hypothetical protein
VGSDPVGIGVTVSVGEAVSVGWGVVVSVNGRGVFVGREGVGDGSAKAAVGVTTVAAGPHALTRMIRVNRMTVLEKGLCIGSLSIANTR